MQLMWINDESYIGLEALDFILQIFEIPFGICDCRIDSVSSGFSSKAIDLL